MFLMHPSQIPLTLDKFRSSPTSYKLSIRALDVQDQNQVRQVYLLLVVAFSNDSSLNVVNDSYRHTHVRYSPSLL